MAEPIRIGIVGCGRILPAHLRGFRLLREAGRDDFRITALVARRTEDALRFRKRGEGPAPRPRASKNPADPLGAPHLYVSEFQPESDPDVFTSVGDMLDSGQVDAVSVTASVAVHHTAGLLALDDGKHLMLEKPLAISVRAGRALVEAAERNGLSLGVMEVVRYDTANRAARWLYERGDLGEIQMIASVAIGTGDWSPDRVVGGTPWRHHKLEAGGGASIDLGVHLAHKLRYLAGEARTVSAIARVFEKERVLLDHGGAAIGRIEADADDAFFALLDMESGAAGMMSFTWAGHGEPTGLPGGLTIYGTRGCIKGTTFIRDDGSREDIVDIFRREADAETRAAYFPWGVTDMFGLAYNDWLDGIRAGRHPETSGEEGLRDLATAFAILESSEAGGAVAVEDVLNGRVDAYQREIDAHYAL